MLYLLALIVPLALSAAEVSYNKGYYKAKVTKINDERTHTGRYMTATDTTSVTTVTNASSEQQNSGTPANPVIIRENSYYSPYKSHGHRVQSEPIFGAIAKIGIGGQYFIAPKTQYQTASGITSNIIEASHTYAVLPIGLEILYNIDSKNSISINGDYYLNPFRSLEHNTRQNIVSFEAMTNYMIYLKYEYRPNRTFGIHLLAGMSQFNLDVYNDINGKLLMTSNTYAPSVGLGSSLYITDNSFIFVDGIYSYVGSAGDSSGISDARLKAVANRSYSGIQVRVGFGYNFGRAIATR